MVDFQERDTRRGLGDLADSPSEHDSSPAEETDDHGHHAHDLQIVGVAILTISSTRTLENDPSGDVIQAGFEAEDHSIATRDLVGDDRDRIQEIVNSLVRRSDVEVVVTTGGTGVTPDDVTVEALRPLFEKTLPGFGELFRRRSEDEIGLRTIASRATAGIADGVPVFCLPGSEDAASLGVDLIVPTIGHLTGLAKHAEAEE
jgi:molybdenum cofactor biosynthesis protein B